MKRVFGALVVLVMVLVVLIGCGPSTDASQRNVNIARQAIEIADSFLDGSISASEAHTQIDNLQSICTDETGNRMEDHANFILSSDMFLLRTSLSFAIRDNSLEGRNLVLENRNRLAERAGIRTRN